MFAKCGGIEDTQCIQQEVRMQCHHLDL
jgi:hypothetical protein